MCRANVDSRSNRSAEILRNVAQGTYRIRVQSTPDGAAFVGRVRLRQQGSELLDWADHEHVKPYFEEWDAAIGSYMSYGQQSCTFVYALYFAEGWIGGPAHGNVRPQAAQWLVDQGDGFVGAPLLADGEVAGPFAAVRLLNVEEMDAGTIVGYATHVYTAVGGKLRVRLRWVWLHDQVVPHLAVAMFSPPVSNYRPIDEVGNHPYDPTELLLLEEGVRLSWARSPRVLSCTSRRAVILYGGLQSSSDTVQQIGRRVVIDCDGSQLEGGNFMANALKKWVSVNKFYTCQGIRVPVLAGDTWSATWDIYVEDLKALPGDVNCDGPIDFGDISPFVDAIQCSDEPDPAACWAAQHSDCPYSNADVNQDGEVSHADVNVFVKLLLSPAQPDGGG